MRTEAQKARRRELRAGRKLERERVRLGLPVVPEEYPEGVRRPTCRDECRDAPRPCPFVSCKWHLFITDIAPDGRIHTQETPPWELTESCALDVAEREQPLPAREVGEFLGCTSSRVLQIEVQLRAKLGVELREWKT